MAKVFISHANADQQPAEEVRRWLVAEKHQVFLDQDPRDGLEVGEEWEQRLYERLRWADAVVCVVTSAFRASEWCTYEVACARARGSRLLPVRAEPKVDHPLLTSAQYTDLTKDPTASRAALVKVLRRVDAGGGLGWADDRLPFPGLRPFEVEDHQVFFGRSGEVEQLADLLRSPAERAERAVLLVVGPSGCGKSSLVRAGLLPVMAEEPGWWTLPPILPGTDPVAALIRQLAAAAQQLGCEWTVEKVRHQLEDNGLTGLADELLLAAEARRLLVVVDQFEELLTQTPRRQRAQFAQLLGTALGGPVQVVATLRPEFLSQLLVDAELAVLPTRSYTLRPLRRDGLRTVIEGPARLAGIAVNDDLVTRLVTDTNSGEALPLLAFTLSQLAEDVHRGGQLSTARYDQLGEVQGALARQADAALADATAATGRRPEDVIAGLLRLVTVDEHGRRTRWRVLRAELPEPVTQELDAFVTRRLLTTDADDNVVVVGVAHEAFLYAWPPLARAIEKNKIALRARRDVEQAATEWHDEGGRLWERGQLAAAMADTGAHLEGHDLVTDHVELSPTARVFLRDSFRRDRFRRGRAVTVLSVLLVFAVVAAGIAVIQQRAAEHQRNVAVSRQVAGQAPQLRATNSALAAQLGLAAYQLAATTEARGSLLSTFATPYATQLTDHLGTVYSVAFSPDGHTLATASDDHTVQLWDVRDPHRPSRLGTLTGYSTAVYAVAFSPDGHTLATASEANVVRLWDVTEPRHPDPRGTLPGYSNTVYSVAFSPDGTTLATASKDTTARLWDVHDSSRPSPLSTLVGHTDSVKAVAFSSDGNTVATAGVDKTARLWDVRDPHHPNPLRTLTGHTNTIRSVAFSPDGHILATASDASAEGTVRLWDVRDPLHPRPLATLPDYLNTVRSVTFSPDGSTLATASSDITARLWDVRDPYHPNPLRTLTGHTNTVYSVAFSPDGHTLVTASFDRTVRLWDLPGPLVAGHTKTVFAVAFSPDGHTLATASDDTTARLWNVRDPDNPRPLGTLTGHRKEAKMVAFSPDGHTLATASDDTTARLWDVSDPATPRRLGTLTGHTNAVRSAAFSPDGHSLATGSADNTARLWDISNPRSPRPIATLPQNNDVVWWVAFSPDGRTLVTASADHTAQWWDVHDPHQPSPLSTIKGHTGTVRSVAFSPDGRTLAIANESTVRLWEVSDPHQLPRKLSTLVGNTGGIYSVAFSPDGHTLATASYDNIARLWDVTNPGNPRVLGTLTGHTDTVFSVAFSPDGHTLATGSADKTARLWETNTDSVATRICRIAPPITTSEWNQYLPSVPYQPPCLHR
ncbi:MAG: TIR domain-containing protein [Pseudonocardiaceae bacterium]